MGNRQGVEHPRQATLAAGGNLAHQIVGGLSPHSLQRQQVIAGQPVEVGVVAHKPGRHELLDQLFAQSLDLHRTSGSKKLEPLPLPCRAVHVGAADVDALGVPHQRRVAFRALRRWRPLHQPLRAEVLLHSHDMRNHLARLFHDEHITHANILAGDLVGVVEACSADGGARQLHWLKIGHGRDRAAAANLHANPCKRGGRLVFLKLPGDRPAGALARAAEPPLLLETVDLDDEAIDLEIELVQGFDLFAAMLDQSLDRGKRLRPGSDRKPHGNRPGKQIGLRMDRQAAGIAEPVAEKPQRSGRSELRVEEADAACGNVAGVGKGRQPLGRLLLVEPHEIRVGHVDLAADIKPRRGRGKRQL